TPADAETERAAAGAPVSNAAPSHHVPSGTASRPRSSTLHGAVSPPRRLPRLRVLRLAGAARGVSATGARSVHHGGWMPGRSGRWPAPGSAEPARLRGWQARAGGLGYVSVKVSLTRRRPTSSS